MIAFYQEILQLSPSYKNDWFIEFRISESTFISVADEQRASIKSASGGGITLSWQVSNIKKAHDKLRAREIAVSELAEKWGALVCYFRDPEGNRIELWETLPN